MSVVFFIIFIFIFFIILEIICILFKLTGLTDEKARFQVISIITGTGFTTRESELITQHKTRRKLAQYVMILGYVGLATFISFIATILGDLIMKNLSINDFVVIIGFLAIVFYILKHKKLIIYLDNFIEKIILKTRIKSVSNKNLYTLLSRKHGYGIYNIFIDEKSFLVGKSIIQSSLKDKEIQILNIDKGDNFISFPKAQYIFEVGDNVMVYGKIDSILKTFKIR